MTQSLTKACWLSTSYWRSYSALVSNNYKWIAFKNWFLFFFNHSTFNKIGTNNLQSWKAWPARITENSPHGQWFVRQYSTSKTALKTTISGLFLPTKLYEFAGFRNTLHIPRFSHWTKEHQITLSMRFHLIIHQILLVSLVLHITLLKSRHSF